MEKDIFINAVVNDMDELLDGEQLLRLKTILILRLRDFKIEKESRELAIYDPTGDVAAYKQYFVSKKIQGLSLGTLEQYRYVVDRFMIRTNKKYSDVTTNDIRLYLADRSMVDNLGNASLIRERGAICRFFKWLYEEEFIPKNPGAKVELIKPEKRLKEPFTELELERMRACCNNTKESAVIELLMSTWGRVSEICSMHLDNLDRITGAITVIGKGNKEKVAFINARAQIALTAYHYHYKIEGGPLIHGRKKGQPMTPSGIQKIVKKIGDRAGVENVHPHRFRRTGATLALKKDMQLDKIMKLLGHESIDTTMLYAIVSNDDLAHAHKKFV